MRRKKKANLTKRSIDLLRSEGWIVDRVEHWNSYSKRSKDLFGLFDILAVKDGVVKAVQVTDFTHLSARLKKIMNSDLIGELSKAMSIEVHGWKKVNNRWTLKKKIIS